MLTMPIHISLSGKKILIVGGGSVAMRKAGNLFDTGADVTVVAPLISDFFRAGYKNLKLHERSYYKSDIEGKFLVIAATNDHDVNQQISSDCKLAGILILVADDPESGDCIFPALLKREELTITVSTGGKSPGYAVYVRDKIASIIDARYGEIVKQLAAEREKLLTEGNCKTYNSKILRQRICELLANKST